MGNEGLREIPKAMIGCSDRAPSNCYATNLYSGEIILRIKHEIYGIFI